MSSNGPVLHMSGLMSSVRRALASKRRGTGFKPYQTQWVASGCGLVTVIMWGYSARLKSSFDLNPVTEGKQGTFPFFQY